MFFTFGAVIELQELRYQRFAVCEYSGVIDALLLQHSDDVNNTGYVCTLFVLAVPAVLGAHAVEPFGKAGLIFEGFCLRGNPVVKQAGCHGEEDLLLSSCHVLALGRRCTVRIVCKSYHLIRLSGSQQQAMKEGPARDV